MIYLLIRINNAHYFYLFFSLLIWVRGNFVGLYAMSVIPFVGKNPDYLYRHIIKFMFWQNIVKYKNIKEYHQVRIYQKTLLHFVRLG